ncbi:hypothetical protein U5903_04290 [Cereibacter johrii]|nr:hypothetical protein [Cereibacter johrii]MEA5159988.1 hypothetical protein [Cereibacter johrii]
MPDTWSEYLELLASDRICEAHDYIPFCFAPDGALDGVLLSCPPREFRV